MVHVVPGDSELLLSLSDSIDLRNDQLHLETPRATEKLSTTPAGHYEIDLPNRASGLAVVASLTRTPGSTVKVLAKDGNTSQVLREGRAAALRPAASCLKCCQIRDSKEKWSAGFVCSLGTHGGMQTPVCCHESDTQSIAGPGGGDCCSSDAEWETLCVYHGHKQFVEPGDFEIR